MAIQDWERRDLFDFEVGPGRGGAIDDKAIKLISGRIGIKDLSSLGINTIPVFTFHSFWLKFDGGGKIVFQLAPYSEDPNVVYQPDMGYQFEYLFEPTTSDPNVNNRLTITIKKDFTDFSPIVSWQIANLNLDTWYNFKNEYNTGVDYMTGNTVGRLVVRDGNNDILLQIDDTTYQNSKKRLWIWGFSEGVWIDDLEIWELI